MYGEKVQSSYSSYTLLELVPLTLKYFISIGYLGSEASRPGFFYSSLPLSVFGQMGLGDMTYIATVIPPSLLLLPCILNGPW